MSEQISLVRSRLSNSSAQCPSPLDFASTHRDWCILLRAQSSGMINRKFIQCLGSIILACKIPRGRYARKRYPDADASRKS